MTITLDAAPNAPSYSNPDTFETDTSNYLAWMKTIRNQLSGIALEKGDGGLLTTAAPLLSNLDAHTIESGIYLVDNTKTTGTFPAESSVADVVIVLKPAGNQTTQLYFGPNLNSPSYFRKSSSNTGWKPWTRILSDEDKVQSYTDIGAGRLLVPGYFGLGGSAINMPNLNDVAVNGFYKIASANAAAGNAPTGAGNWEVFHTQFDASAGSQIAIAAGVSSPGAPIWWRTRSGGIWNAWTRLDAYGGSNANGRYVRHPDGTQICTHLVNFTDMATATGNIFTTNGEITWDFPASFKDGTGLNVAASVRQGTAWATGRVFNNTRGLLRAFHPTSVTGAFTLEVRAFGYYK